MDVRKITVEEFDTLWLRLNGQLTDQGDIPNLFADGAPCALLYQQVTDARLRLSEHAGIGFEDYDLLEIIQALEEIARLCALGAVEYLGRS